MVGLRPTRSERENSQVVGTCMVGLRPTLGQRLHLDRPAQRPVEPELGLVVVGHRAEVFAPGLIEGLDRLEGLDRQPLPEADPLQVPPVRVAGGLDAGLGHGDLAAERLALGVGLDDLPGHAVHELDLEEPGCSRGSGRLSGRRLAGAEVAKLQ